MNIIQKNEIEHGNKTRDIIFLKEDLERYYIDEKKSIAEISRIYDCSKGIIERRLKKYKISIRPYGAFSVNDDGETLKSKCNRGEISYKEYADFNSRKRGFKDDNDRKKQQNYKKCRNLPMSENKKCSQYLGIHICENKEFLSKIINIIKSMPNNNPGYDVVCVKDKKIDVKCACLSDDSRWVFHIRENKDADYFLMISFDNREYLNVQHIWLVKDTAVIEKTTYNSHEFIVNEKDSITINKGNRALKRWKKYEITDIYKLEEAQKLCDTFKNKNIKSKKLKG